MYMHVCHVVPNQQLGYVVWVSSFFLATPDFYHPPVVGPAAESMEILLGAGADGFSDCASVR